MLPYPVTYIVIPYVEAGSLGRDRTTNMHVLVVMLWPGLLGSRASAVSPLLSSSMTHGLHDGFLFSLRHSLARFAAVFVLPTDCLGNRQVIEDSDDIGWHWDKDYGMEAQGVNVHPCLATVTYLSASGGPTVILEKKVRSAVSAVALPLSDVSSFLWPRLSYSGVFSSELKYLK